ncbi:MAG: aspartate--ammonia ligase [Clostridia bacterium]|nr:aspartate--ammonia ligase [Clostridia bacterium]
MSKVILPDGYVSRLGLYDTQAAISLIKDTFQQALSAILRLKRVSAPLFVDPNEGLNDNLNGVERPVRFDAPGAGRDCEVVHSLAKWKRYALARYGFRPGQGLYTDMNAIRRDEELDNLHSIYVDQWDWEKVLTREDRTEAYLEKTVRSIVEAILYTEAVVTAKYPALSMKINREVTFVTSEELLRMYPDKTPKERENLFAKEHGTVFIKQIGDKLSDGKPHDGRAPDYDDWALNGDLLVWYPVLGCAFELSSMGIRVDEVSLASQLKKAGCEERAELPFHKALLNKELPLTIGGGIGQSRLCMLLLEKAHIGEVQSSLWDKETIAKTEAHGITLL